MRALLLLALATACTPEPGPEPAGDCDHTGFAADGEEFTWVTGYDAAVYGAATADTPWDGLNVELYADLGGPTGPATVTFTGEGYDTCGACLTIARACSSTSDCAQDFLADSGTLELTAYEGRDGGALAGRLTDVRLVEVTIDATTYASTPVPDGEVWCLDEYAFDGTLQ